MSQWTSKYAMLKDLSVAQGRRVPASLEPNFGNKPPSLNFVEDTEEEFYKEYIGNADFNAGPDIGLIQEMLSLVKERRLSSDEEPDKVIIVSKLNPMIPEFVPSDTDESKNVSEKKPKKKRHNVALTSILDALETVEKEQAMRDAEATAKKPLQLLPMMFRRKKIENPVNSISNAITSPVNSDCASYKPSTMANEYYNKFVEKSRLKEIVQEDIWTRAEKKMKEIDEKKKLEALESSPSSSHASSGDTSTSDDSSSVAHGVEYVSLAEQRHLLSDECVVCEITKKHGYDIKWDL